MDYSGKIIKKTPVTPSQTSASGVWTLDDALQATKNNSWPVANVPNPISRSLRFRQSASAYLNRTPASAGNRRTFTISTWVKRGVLDSGTYQTLMWATTDTTQYFGSYMQFWDNNNLSLTDYRGTYNAQLVTTQVLRDPSAWYHIVWSVDTTQATASNRIKLYVNGSQVTSFSTATYPSQNFEFYFNATGNHNIGRDFASSPGGGARNYLDGYMTEVNFIDGQALTPSSFGGTNAVTGVWEPRQYTGTYGTNGFYLNFKDNTSTSTLGLDYSGNNNTWTTNNISLTAGSTYDSMLDVPTQWVGYNTGDLASVTRGNYAVLNPLDAAFPTTQFDGNLRYSTSSPSHYYCRHSIQLPTSGKWYWEVTATWDANSRSGTGVLASSTSVSSYPWGTAQSYGWYLGSNTSNWYWSNNGSLGFNIVPSSGAVFQICYDADNGTIYAGINNTFYNSAGAGTGSPSTLINPTSSSVPTGLFPATGGFTSGSMFVNHGQRPFSYTPPAGFLALCTTNLPTPTIGATASSQAGKYFNPVLYTGTGSARSVTGVGFQPDFVWIKNRGAVASHGLNDVVRGAGKFLYSNLTDAEGNFPTDFASFDSDGFSLGNGTGLVTNTNGVAYVAWNWKANGTGVTNTAGSITSTVSANTTSGFSVVTFTAPATTGSYTVGHGLGVAPKMVITKRRDSTSQWWVWHISLGDNTTDYLSLNSTNVEASASGMWGTVGRTSTVLGYSDTSIAVNSTQVAYCFSEVAGFSKFGSYTGNGSTDGPFVYTGFRPRYLLVKNTTSAVEWEVYDSARNPSNGVNLGLIPNASDAEGTYSPPRFDFLSNGFKLRTSGGGVNGSGNVIIYAAFAENPFKNALAR